MATLLVRPNLCVGGDDHRVRLGGRASTRWLTAAIVPALRRLAVMKFLTLLRALALESRLLRRGMLAETR